MPRSTCSSLEKNPLARTTRGHKRGEKNEKTAFRPPAPSHSFTVGSFYFSLTASTGNQKLSPNRGLGEERRLKRKKRTPASFWRPSVRNEASKRRNGYSLLLSFVSRRPHPSLLHPPPSPPTLYPDRSCGQPLAPLFLSNEYSLGPKKELDS